MIHWHNSYNKQAFFFSPRNCTDLKSYLTGDTKCLKLIDFGRTIDMNFFPEDTTFLSKVNTSGFQCIEMRTDQPWTYQVTHFI